MHLLCCCSLPLSLLLLLVMLLQESVRAKVRNILSKSLNAEIATALESSQNHSSKPAEKEGSARG